MINLLSLFINDELIYFITIINILNFIFSLQSSEIIDIDNQRVPYEQVEDGYSRWKGKKNSNILLIPANTLYCSSIQELKKAQTHKTINEEIDTSYLFRINCFTTSTYAEGAGIVERDGKIQILFQQVGDRLKSGYFMPEGITSIKKHYDYE